MPKAWAGALALLACVLGGVVTYHLSTPPGRPDTPDDCLLWGLNSERPAEVQTLCATLFAAKDEQDTAAAQAAVARVGANLGETLQPGTDLFWLRCPVGMTWNGSGCDGTPEEIPLERVLRACPSFYQVPTRDDFIALLDVCEDHGTYCQCEPCARSLACAALSAWDTADYWARPPPGKDSGAWVVELESGHIRRPEAEETYHLRCVRRGP